MMLEPAIELQHAFDKGFGVCLTPGLAAMEAFLEDMIITDHRQVVQRREVATFGTCFKLLWNGCAAQYDRFTGLTDVLGDTQPYVTIASVVILWSCRHHTPEDI